MKRSIATKDLARVIEDSLLRNLEILKNDVEARKTCSRDSSGFVMISEAELYDMLKATAVNLAMVLSS